MEGRHDDVWTHSERHWGHALKREGVHGSLVLSAVCLALLLDLVLSLLGLPLSLLDLPEGLGVDVDVEGDDPLRLLVVLEDVLPPGGVVDDEVLAVLLGAEVDPADVGVVVGDVVDVDLDDVLVDLLEVVQQLVLELLLSEVGGLAQSGGEEREVGVVLLVVEEEHGLGLSSVHQVVTHLLEFVHGLLHVSVFDEGSDRHSLRSPFSGLLLLHNNCQAHLGSRANFLEEVLGLGLSLLLDD